MGRFAPEGHLRLAQTMPGRMNLTFGGAEANVCAAVSLLGGQSSFVTALPDNPLGDAAISFIRSLGADTSHIVRRENSRLGLYFVEAGANQRPSNVVYDRAGSALASTPASAYNWPGIITGDDWLHVSGITPAVSRVAAEATLAAVETAGQAGATVSCDLNFRKKLWRWDSETKPRDLAEKTMCRILPHVDLLIANEEDAADVLGIHAGASDVDSGQLEIDRYPEVAAEIVNRFPGISRVAITLRESISANHNNWGAMLYDAGSRAACFAPTSNERYRPYEIRNIVDRVGGGDSFAAGLIFALTTSDLQATEKAVSFAVAASCLAHSVYGDINYVSRPEVEALMGGAGSGRVKR